MTKYVRQNSTYNFILGLGIAFLILLVFGMFCVFSKYNSSIQYNRISVFGMNVMRVVDNSSAQDYPRGIKVIVSNSNFDEVKIGDFVVYGNASEGLLYEGNFGKVTMLTADSIDVSSTSSSKNATISKDLFVGIVGASSPLICGLVEFLLSDWLILLFVLVPGISLLVLILLWAYVRLKESKGEMEPKTLFLTAPNLLLLAEKSIVEEGIKSEKTEETKPNEPILLPVAQEIIQYTQPQKPKVKKEKTKKKLKKEEPEKEIEIIAEDKKAPPQIEKKENRYRLFIVKPKRKGDDYIYQKLPKTDTNGPIRQLLSKFSSDENKNDTKSLLLEKMRKQ